MIESFASGANDFRTARRPRVVLDAGEVVLSNGLRLLTLPDPSVPVLSYQVHYAAGSRNERPGITGMAHLFEHMMFKGTPTCGPEQFARTMQAHGGQVNAFTTEDSTCYYETLPSHCLEMAVRAEADRQANLLLTEENLASEREVVRNERLMRTVNTPYGLPREELMALAYPRHSYRWPVVGWDSDLVAITLDQCKAFFATYYAASNTTIVVSGDIDPDRVLALVEDACGALPTRPAAPPVVTREEPQRGERRAIYRKAVEAAAVFSGFHVPEAAHPDTPPLLILAALLSGGESSRFHRRFVKTGRAGHVIAELGFSFLNLDPSLFRIDAIANPGDPPGPLEDEIWEELDRVRHEEAAEEEVGRVVRQLLAQFILKIQTNLYRGLHLGLYQIRTGDWRFVNRLTAALDEVTPADVRRVAQTYLGKDNRSVLVVVPEDR
jgi:predicted Zn-dependent peptidase